MLRFEGLCTDSVLYSVVHFLLLHSSHLKHTEDLKTINFRMIIIKQQIISLVVSAYHKNLRDPQHNLVRVQSILFFSLLRMIVILFQEYYLNDNTCTYIHIYDITSNNVYKQSFTILLQFSSPISLGYTLFDSCFSIFIIAIVLHAAVCQLAK